MKEEAKIESAVCKYAKEKGCYVRKFKSTSQRGVPDRLFISPLGHVFFVEFKAPGKRPTALQERELREIQKRGGRAHWASCVNDGKSIVDFYLK
tara:strand:+ start:5951 stop:6232 length:282 start_codon:yes stop_codon:yes gene_type:complete